jgi:hypothetical protein
MSSSSVIDADPVAAYQRCLFRLEEARKRVEAFVAVIQNAADRLKDGKWKLGEASRVGEPINYASWPSGQELQVALRAWQDAGPKVRASWSAVPSDRRIGLKPPAECE